MNGPIATSRRECHGRREESRATCAHLFGNVRARRGAQGKYVEVLGGRVGALCDGGLSMATRQPVTYPKFGARALVIFCCAAAVLAACSSTRTSAPAEFVGTWSGNVSPLGSPNTTCNTCAPLTLVLTQSGSTVGGTSTCVGAGSTISWNVTGTVNGDSVTLTSEAQACMGSGEARPLLTCSRSGTATVVCAFSAIACLCCPQPCPQGHVPQPLAGVGTLTKTQ
jgi:hypothetical protein